MLKRIAAAMGEMLGTTPINEELIVKVPDDGCPGHLGVTHWDVYAARAGEFTLLAYAYDNGDITVTYH